MAQNILLSKIVANPTDTTWSQAYSTLNLYIVLSIRSESTESGIVTSGKELLEKIQREYFSLDEKSIVNIKEALGKALEGTDINSISCVLSTIQDRTLHLIIVNQGEIILKRDGKVGVVGKDEEGKIVAFSGNIKSDDIVIIGTGDFSKKIPVEKLSSILDGLEVSEISEHLAPLIHEESQGTEAAIVLQYKSIENPPQEEAIKTPEPQEDDSIEELGHEEEKPKIKIPNLNIPNLSFNITNLGRKKITIIAIVLLIVLLVGSILFEQNRQESSRRKKELSEILTPAKDKYDEAVALVSLNKGLAYEEFDSLKSTLEGSREKFAPNTSERKTLNEFIGKVEGKIGELGAEATIANQKVVYENVDFVSFRDGKLVAVDLDGKIFLLSSDGKVEKEIDSENGNAKSVVADERFVYILGTEGITRTTKSGGTTTIAESPESTISIDNFGSNVYGLNTKAKTVDKYVGETRSDYFVEDIALENPRSMSIDASIWIIDGKKIRKFTRGREDSFSIQGLTGSLGDGSKIFTSLDYSNIYILDPKNVRIISIKKDGEFEKQYSWKNLSSATSFSVDEEGETIYVVIGAKLYSFDL